MSELFRRRLLYAESSGKPWFIVSAFHGLVDPERIRRLLIRAAEAKLRTWKRANEIHRDLRHLGF